MTKSLALFSAGTALFGIIALWLAGAGVQLGAGAVIFAFAALSLMLGYLCLTSWAHIAEVPGMMPAAFALGGGLLSVALSVLVALLNAPIWPAAALCGALVIALWLWQRPRPAPTARTDAITLAGLGVALLILLLSPVSSPAVLANQGYLPIWSDYYVHAVTIYSFSSSFLLGEDIATIAAPRAFYHYAPFMLPALVQSISGVSGLIVATAVLLPMGLLLALMGASALGLRLGGPALALLAFLLLIAPPGPEAFGIRPGWFDFDWLLIASPGSGAAMGLTFAVLWLALHWAENTGRPAPRLLTLIAAATSAVILMRVQIFMLGAPILLAFVLLMYGPRIRRISLIALIAGLLATALALGLSQSLRTLWLDLAQPHVYFDIVLNWSRNYNILKSGWGDIEFGALLSRNLAIAVGSSLGLWTVFSPLLLALILWLKKPQPADLIIPLALFTYTALILMMPAGGNGDISEYKHRHFVFLYMLVTLGSGHLALRLLPARAQMDRAIAPLAGLGIGVVVLSTWGLVFDGPDTKSIPWSADYHSVPFTSGIPEAAEFLAAKAEPGDVFVMNPAHSRNWLGAQPQLISLSGLQAYIGRADQLLARSECLAALARERLALVDAIDASSDPSSAMAMLRDNGIRWYIRLAGDNAAWVNSGDPVLSTPEVSVYDTGAQAPSDLIAPRC